MEVTPSLGFLKKNKEGLGEENIGFLYYFFITIILLISYLLFNFIEIK
jgi:hypothetical protein